ncbi:MED6 mediator sub complex component-domain-containing protein [Glomus cerebriforme]|uniref:Mediator of RNA polymerase II transcription subunit 6 n=1 Tax=Glomus cerebriforme TaxID=658196 RepID=A0A397SSN0_9GLOM|nr:MED6 mediator sub complex component-domain-containing protein [Glomus cerebriforme]
MEIEEPYTVSFRDPEWLLSHPEGLTLENVLDYFAESPFWDSQSNNEVLKMQTKFNFSTDHRPLDITKMTGIEFYVAQADPPSFFLVQKRRRISEYDAIPLATYYIIRGIVYQAPDLYTIIGSRIYTSLYHLHNVCNNIREHVNFHPATGYTWKSDKDDNHATLGNSRILPLLDKELIEFHQAADIAYYSVTRRLSEERERAIKNVEEDNERERERIRETLLLRQQAVLEAEKLLEKEQSIKKKDKRRRAKKPDESKTETKKKKKKHEKKSHRPSDTNTSVRNTLSQKSNCSSILGSTPDGSVMDF